MGTIFEVITELYYVLLFYMRQHRVVYAFDMNTYFALTLYLKIESTIQIYYSNIILSYGLTGDAGPDPPQGVIGIKHNAKYFH